MEGDQDDHAKRRPRYVNPRGRPLDYTGSQGWASRIVNRTLCAAAVGAFSGVVIGVVRRQSPFRLLASTGTSCAIAACCFCGAQELVRELRAADPDDWVNCLLGGFASGAILGRLHGGPARALPVAILFASIGSGLQIGAVQLEEYRLQRFLASSNHEEPAVAELETPLPSKSEAESKAQSSWKFPEWFPIQKLDEEELRRRKLERELQHERMIQYKILQRGDFSPKDH